MQRIFISAFALLGLSGCAFFAIAPPKAGMAAVSESCRFESSTDLSMHGLVNGESAQERDAIFEKTYRSCMAEKGYDIPPRSPSASP